MLNRIFKIPGHSYQGTLSPLTPIETTVKTSLEKIVVELADNIGERNVWKKASLQRAIDFINNHLKKTNLTLSEVAYDLKGIRVKNIIAEKKGETHPEEILIMGAHYDSAINSSGADDNASGVAALLCFANLLENYSSQKTIRLVFFVNEEPPFFFTRKMGSWHYARHCRKNNDNIIGMFSIESIGYYDSKPNTQHYPFPFQFFYPNTGNFIGFVSNIASRKLLQASIDLFRKNTCFPSEGLIAPWFFIGVCWSDQLSFWRHRYPAIMITDTAPFRNPHYHTFSDKAATLDYDRCARVVLGLFQMLKELDHDYSIGIL